MNKQDILQKMKPAEIWTLSILEVTQYSFDTCRNSIKLNTDDFSFLH